jgi:hypothetical protein
MHTYQTKGLHRQMMMIYTFCHCEFAYLFKTEFWNRMGWVCAHRHANDECERKKENKVKQSDCTLWRRLG